MTPFDAAAGTLGDTNDSGGGRGGRVVDPHATADERTYATFIHLTLLLVHMGIPVIGALVMWLIKRHQSPFLDDHGKEAVNFQISLLIYAVLVLPIAAILTCGVGAILIIPIYILGIYGMITGAMAANRGEYYRYPMCLRLLA